jgi:hypothetical protein
MFIEIKYVNRKLKKGVVIPCHECRWLIRWKKDVIIIGFKQKLWKLRKQTFVMRMEATVW